MGLFDKLKKAFTKPDDYVAPLDSTEAPLSEAHSEVEVTEKNAAELDLPLDEVTEGEQEGVIDDEAAEEASDETTITLSEPKSADLDTKQAEIVIEAQASASLVPETKSIIQEKYEKGLKKTRKTFGERLNELFANFRSVDEDFFEELEEALIGADVGFEVSLKISEALRQEVKLKNAKNKAQIRNTIIEKMVSLYEADGIDENNDLNLQSGLTVMLFVGVNGVGKTTSIGKLAHTFKQQGKKVMLAAADTFRAGAINQLVEWGNRADVEVVRGPEGGDPAAVVFDAIESAKAEQVDILLIDTAGRLQNKVNLMKELEKINRVIQRELPDAPHETLLVLDATTGQNAIEQAKQFKEVTGLTGLVLSKLDGTAKGGIVLAIRSSLHLPVKLVGLGEGINDLEAFNPENFIIGLFKDLLVVE
ncbi:MULTISPECIES: signal recognition particle-docking protein FtsY [unclassified Enterococcus]|uniref:signal recognition particle-docking protein FtsY n=1 Tax=unclassified Enterococcus TaxID=2608891 RepID=UPI0015565CAA|nr:MULTISPECIES: signal recognition particle-docking protein FtsY [unclassified Enterococcus]MBS7576290.1 signal recognition particle-docking protein FtsY [Enterococcus sp. MMGLQ5-2]MBS7583523.1 signal recognition particle-docking protein FtsY [Enterococcus sp. MMGLQ5-1]NPD11385.1 signal recognition particle-docking protein FtsY [Enterococcus sp. MMGLQ5-1]NPD36128.1 signal recognition particle-docking protein FtsY [Enterococcus sp. MMGLQ5-2]